MCGIVGFLGHEDVGYEVLQGLIALQHRGQDACGIATFKNNFRLKKGLGLVNTVFAQTDLEYLQGKIGLGHVRYTTQSTNDAANAQPISANYPYGLSMVHNGNVINFKSLRKTLVNEFHIMPETTNDLELIMYSFATILKTKDLNNLTPDDVFDCVAHTQQAVKGAYATITIIANQGLLAFTDPYGIRPLVFGKRVSRKGTVYGFASETTCFDTLGYEIIKDLEPGEAIFIDMDSNVHIQKCYVQPPAFCVFEYIYFAREDSIIHNKLVAAQRVRFGRMLARKVQEAGLEPDIIIDIPSSGYFSASGLAEALNVPYRRGFVKNNHVGRSFIAPTQELREKMVNEKLNPIKSIVNGKKVAVVDDSIVRGTTSKRIVQLLKRAGAAQVYFISSAPPIQNPCIYGIDMAMSAELIAANNSPEEICRYIGADAVIYQDLNDLVQLYEDLPLCHACFSGEYPAKGSRKALKHIAVERIASKNT